MTDAILFDFTKRRVVRQKDGRPPPMEPHRFEYQYGYSSVVHPNGSVICLSHAAPEELQTAMTLAWVEAKKEAGQWPST